LALTKAFRRGAGDENQIRMTSWEGRVRWASKAISDCEKCPHDTADHLSSDLIPGTQSWRISIDSIDRSPLT